MATLRNTFSVRTTDDQSLLNVETARAAGMSALRRGYEAGRLGTEMNAALADEAAARAAGDAAATQAAVDTQQRTGLRQRLYAPEVARVEDIGGIGDAATWASSQVGQGVASMQDPVALAAAGQGVSTAMRAVPGLRGLAAVPAAAGALGAFGINQRQMTGEFYGNLKEDPAALQRLTPQEANQAANVYGLGAGALETVVPAVAGRALGGAALRAGAKAPGVVSGTLQSMGMEGATELAQGELGRAGVGMINPERDTSGDMSARINEFAGGAVGGAPFGAAGAVADNAYARTANAGERVKEAAGTVIDLADSAAEKTGLKTAAGKLGEVIDLSLDKGKDVWDRLDEAGGAPGVAKAAKEQLQRLRMSADEASLLSGVMPDDLPPEQASAWMQDNDAKRLEVMMPRLAELADAGDERANQILAQIESGDPVAQGQGIDQGAAILLEQNDYAQAMERAAQFKENLNGFLRTAGSAAGKAAGMAGRGALSAAKGLAEGLAEGAKGKKSMQGVSTLDYDTWKSWRDKNHPTPTSEPGSTHAIQKAVEGQRRLAEHRGQVPVRVNPEQAEASKRRATLFAELIAAEAEVAAQRPGAHRVNADGTVDVVNYARSIGFEVADMATWAAGRKGSTPTAGKMASFDALTGQIDALAADMRGVLGEGAGEVVQRLLAASDPASKPFLEYLGERVDGWQAGTASRATGRKDLGIQMAALLPQEHQQELLAGGGAAAGKLTETVLQVARGRVAPAQRAALEKALGGPQVLTQLLQMVGDQTADETLVEDAPATQAEGVALTDDGEVDTDAGAATSADFETRQAERKVGRNSAPKMYVFHGEKAQSIRNSDAGTRNNRDPFAPTERMSQAEVLEARQRAAELGEGADSVVPVKRPRLVRGGAEGSEQALSNKVSQLEKTLGVDRTPENFFRLSREELQQGANKPGAHAVTEAAKRRTELDALGRLEAKFKAGDEAAAQKVREAMGRFFISRAGGYRVDVVSAKQVMDDAKMTDAHRLSIFRDYMLQEGKDGGEKFKTLARMAQKALLDSVDGVEGKNTPRTASAGLPQLGSEASGQRAEFRLTAGERRTLKAAMDRYFGQGFMVRAEQLSDRAPGQISTGELLELARAGRKARNMIGKAAADAQNNPAVASAAREEIESGLLNFKQREGANLLGTQDTTLSIPTQALVAWVRNNRREEVDEKVSGEKAFLRDLLDGIATLTDSGMVDGLPWVNGKDGEQQRFAGTRVPGNLALPNRKGWQYNKGLGERAKAREGKDANEPADQDAVAEDQARGAEPFVADPLEGAPDNVRYKTFEEPASGKAGTSPFRRRTTYAERNEDAMGSIDTKREDAQIDAEVEDLRNRSAGEDASIGREIAMTALRMAPERAGSVFARRGKEATSPLDLKKTFTNIQNRLAAAERAPESELHGGAHYAYPLAHALSVKNVQALLDSGLLNDSQSQRLINAQLKTAKILSGVPPAHRLPLAAAMAKGMQEVKTFAEATRVLESMAQAVPGVTAPRPKAQPAPAGARKLSLLSTQVHNDLGRGGFAATHDSPIRHDGKFDWRTNKLKGEGAMAFGAGTYLSTDDKVHSFYKKMMTDKAGGTSPTYHVSVQAMKAQLMRWNKPFAQQSGLVQRVLRRADLELGLVRQDIRAAVNGDLEVYEQRLEGMTGADAYLQLAAKLGSKEKASDWLQANGVLGHEYPGAGGRSDYNPNYVIYDDSKIVTNYVHFNQQRVNQNPAPSDKDVAAAKDYLERVLGPQIKAEFKEITGYSGEWIESENLLLVSTLTNAGVLNVARHEALHAFFSKFIKANPKAVRVLSTLTDDPRVMRRLQALLKDEPAALEQLQDGEERLAYTYQFAMAGQLKLPHTPGTTLLHKVRKFLRRVFQMVSDQERAVDLLYAFEAGKFREPSAGARALAATLDQGSWLRNGTKHFDGVMQRAAAMVMPANTVLAESASPTARELATMFFTNPGEEKAGHGEPGYLNARNQQMRRYDNLFRSAIDKLDVEQMSELMEAMQNETPTEDLTDPDVAEAKEKLHGMFERFYRYMTDEKGLRLGKINENYFPVVWDPRAVANPEFQVMLMSKYRPQMELMARQYNSGLTKGGKPINADDVPQMLANRIMQTEGLLETQAPFREDGVLRPWFASGERRALNFIAPEDRAPFLEKDLVTTLSRYVRQGVRTAEYSARFGRQGRVLSRMLMQAQAELEGAAKRKLAEGDFKDKAAAEQWASRQYRDVADAAGAMEGTLGNDISALTRNVNSWSIVYQNVRLLPLALFSNFVDPLGIIARGGEAREAFQAFVDGLKGVARGWKDMISDMPPDRQKDQWEQLAEHAGVIDGAVFSHLITDEYGSMYLEGRTKRINELMFKANGMEAWNRAMRVGATRSAVRFIERHAKLPDQHSARWLAELGLDPKSLPLDDEGRLITSKLVLLDQNPDMSTEQAEQAIGKVHTALVRWVEGAVLSPNAAQRPAWGSDPHFSMFWHLKQFAYSFHETMIKRALNEAKHGNVVPLGVFSWYIPAIIASDVTKGLMMNGGELPQHLQGYDLGDWAIHGVERSGVLGIGNIAADAMQDPLSLAGPMTEQIADIFTGPADQNLVRALPMNSLYANAL